MKTEEINQDLYKFVEENSEADVNQLRLKGFGKIFSFDYSLALTQIICRRKNKRKLGNFLKNKKFLFPSELAAEQATHEAVAAFHASLSEGGTSLLDMTAGLGIDVFSMARCFKKVVACELDETKARILEYNSEVCEVGNIEVINADSVKWLEETDRKFDVIYIDPARRDENNSRVYNFHDCKPDILENIALLLERSRRLFIKASPLLDISQTLKDVEKVRAVRVICVAGECKEILIEATSESESKVCFEAIDLNNNGDINSRFQYEENQSLSSKELPLCNHGNIEVTIAEIDDIKSDSYLYEPNAAIMKLACWRQLKKKYPNLKKFDLSSHLFVSAELYSDFPGRILKIEKMIGKKERKTLKGLPLNVVVRNFPISADQLRKDLKVKEGSDRFIYGSRIKSPVLILAERLDSKI